MMSVNPLPFRARRWRLAHGREVTLGPRGLIMAIVNVTPDSFSDGGLHRDPGQAHAAALEMLTSGADILDIGGESTRPGAKALDPGEEIARVRPVIQALARMAERPILSIDTYHPETARMAIGEGAHIVNDIFGFQGPHDLAGVVAETGAAACLMHNGRLRQASSPPGDVVADQKAYFARSLQVSDDCAIARERVVLDPGFGFGKDRAENIALMADFDRLDRFDLPLMAGTSRKRFLGDVTGRAVSDRDTVTAATSALLRLKGAAIVRVHAVGPNRDALLLADAIIAASKADIAQSTGKSS